MAVITSAMDSVRLYPSPEEILNEVRNFVKGSAQEAKTVNVEVAKSALFLLKTLPSARHAVMQHLCNVFDEAVNSHLLQKELHKEIPENADLENVIEDVNEVIMGFVKSNPNAWAPIISAWAVELLGNISSKYADRGGVPHSSLNEVLQLWMTCPATKALIDLTSQCFSSMVDNTPDWCVDALLEASVKHSPHFDWVVAHIGSCFPNTVISRVLMCGLKDFALHADTTANVKASKREPKMGSVVSILGHLAARHSRHIRLSIIQLFKDSLGCDNDDMMVSVVPYLLHLASLSPMLLDIISRDFVQTVTPEVLNKLAKHLVGKPNKTYEGSSLLDLIVFLITQCGQNTYQILVFLLKTAYPPSLSDDAMDTEEHINPVAQQTTQLIMEKVLTDLEKMVYVRKPPNQAQTAPILRDLQNHCPAICKLMLEADNKSCDWVRRLVTCIGTQSNESLCAQILYAIATSNTSPDKLFLFLQIQHSMQSKFPDILSITMDMCMQELAAQPRNNEVLLRNLHHLLKWEVANPQSPWIGLKVHHYITENLGTLAEVLNKGSVACSFVAMEILVHTCIPDNMDVSKSILLAHSAVAYLFRTMHLSGSADKTHQCQLGSKLIIKLCHLPAIQKTMIRLILEETLSKKNAMLFGSKLPAGQGSKKEKQVLLIDDMRRDQSVAELRPRRGTLFHGGVIGQGLTNPAKSNHLTKEEQTQNKITLLETLWGICHRESDSTTSGTMDVKLAQYFALLLIEFVTPDVMYNGIPWLDEEFCKVTVERDLQVKSKMDENPILWDIIDIAATGAGAMCYCSSILRSVMATLITYWEGCREKVTANAPQQLHATCRLIQAMRKGSLLPAPLCYVDELVVLLPPFETSVILHTIWLFMHEEPPIPDAVENASRVCDPKRHLEAVRTVMLSHIDKVGHLFSHFFPNELVAS